MLKFSLVLIFVSVFLVFFMWEPVRKLIEVALDLSIFVILILSISLLIWVLRQA